MRRLTYRPDGEKGQRYEVCFGVVGTVGDLLQEGILEYADYSPETWAFLPAPGVIQKPRFGKTRQDALANLPKM